MDSLYCAARCTDRPGCGACLRGMQPGALSTERCLLTECAKPVSMCLLQHPAVHWRVQLKTTKPMIVVWSELSSPGQSKARYGVCFLQVASELHLWSSDTWASLSSMATEKGFNSEGDYCGLFVSNWDCRCRFDSRSRAIVTPEHVF